jgi:hypothetical protein
MSANVVRYRSAAFLSSAMRRQPNRLPSECEPCIAEGASIRRRASRHGATSSRAPSDSAPSNRGPCNRALSYGAGWLGLSALLFAGLVACGSAATPDPKLAVTELTDAVTRRDGAAVHAMLDADSRSRITVEEVQALLERDGTDIAQRLSAVPKQTSEVQASAMLPGGELVSLEAREGRFWVNESSALSAFAVTPLDALTGLRRALEQPDYGLLLQLLSSDVREQVETRRRALIEALSDVRTLDVAVQGDRAVVNTADGHRVELELESGIWRVRDFE